MITQADCLALFDETLTVISRAFRLLEAVSPPPDLIPTTDGWSRRYATPSVEHALLMKLARMVSITSGLRQLVAAGQAHEQGILQRAADETGEDIFFLVFGQQNGLKAIHKSYLKHFWREEFEGTARPATYKLRHMVRRKEIREFMAEQTPCAAQDTDRMIYGVYSGFVHGASTHIYDLIDLDTGRYRLRGISGGFAEQGYLRDALNYPVRMLMAGCAVARSIGEELVANELLSLSDEVLARIGAQNL